MSSDQKTWQRNVRPRGDGKQLPVFKLEFPPPPLPLLEESKLDASAATVSTAASKLDALADSVPAAPQNAASADVASAEVLVLSTDDQLPCKSDIDSSDESDTNSTKAINGDSDRDFETDSDESEHQRTSRPMPVFGDSDIIYVAFESAHTHPTDPSPC